jgi:hypothetical protein
MDANRAGRHGSLVSRGLLALAVTVALAGAGCGQRDDDAGTPASVKVAPCSDTTTTAAAQLATSPTGGVDSNGTSGSTSTILAGAGPSPTSAC